MTAEDRKKLLRKFHTLAAKAGMDADAKADFLDNNYGVYSSADLTAEELKEVCESLQGSLQSDEGEKWRRRVMASIGGYLSKNGYENNDRMIKAMACRAAGYKSFNKIPVSRLRNVYHEFLEKQKTAQRVEKIKAEDSYYKKVINDFAKSEQYKIGN